jgi:Zn-dependent M28 family amino/carboxypeptidase
MKRGLLGFGALVVLLLALLVLVNLNSLDDGVRYLRDMLAYSPAPSQPLDPNGRFGFCDAFTRLRNAQRQQFILNYLDGRSIPYERIPIYDTNFDDVLVRLGAQGPLTIFSAHYDKVYDDPDYQAASDNSAAVCMLLVAAEELTKTKITRPAAILFTGREEVGLVGAQAFYEYATQNGIQVSQVLNFDNIGRAGLAVRASGERSGYTFTIPLLGEYTYDGRTVATAKSYTQPPASVVNAIAKFFPITVYDRMLAKSDGTYWQNRGWDAVNITSDDIYYLDETWHTYGDRVELLDQTNLERALQLVKDYYAQEN